MSSFQSFNWIKWFIRTKNRNIFNFSFEYILCNIHYDVYILSKINNGIEIERKYLIHQKIAHKKEKGVPFPIHSTKDSMMTSQLEKGCSIKVLPTVLLFTILVRRFRAGFCTCRCQLYLSLPCKHLYCVF